MTQKLQTPWMLGWNLNPCASALSACQITFWYPKSFMSASRGRTFRGVPVRSPLQAVLPLRLVLHSVGLHLCEPHCPFLSAQATWLVRCTLHCASSHCISLIRLLRSRCRCQAPLIFPYLGTAAIGTQV